MRIIAAIARQFRRRSLYRRLARFCPANGVYCCPIDPRD